MIYKSRNRRSGHFNLIIIVTSFYSYTRHRSHPEPWSIYDTIRRQWYHQGGKVTGGEGEEGEEETEEGRSRGGAGGGGGGRGEEEERERGRRRSDRRGRKRNPRGEGEGVKMTSSSINSTIRRPKPDPQVLFCQDTLTGGSLHKNPKIL